ncbi:MAG: iron ABC transporter permease [Anaerolineales bacterium]|nr:iron ABC transporter permease [Anaerolineales bacterium]MCX7608494.1 iron ABC transporter permease [Anaerolineales bacterium]MDW8227170.1 iron ABC transporter permease [Anaerolineales bacterium]
MSRSWLFPILLILLVLAFALSLALGSVRIPLDQVVRILLGGEGEKASWTTILFDFRLPKAITATLVGAALATAGLQMQTLFRNPLADPFILGISSGASLGVALVVLGIGVGGALTFVTGLSLFGNLTLALAASLGAGTVLGAVLLISQRVQNTLTLLVIGLMFGYLASAIVTLLIYFSQPERVQLFSLWASGSFGGVTWEQMRVFAPVALLGLFLGFVMIKPLNALLLGDDYARSLGLNVRRARFWIILSASLLAGVSTAFCGPIWFIGVAVPHVARSLLNTADHRLLLPACLLLGASFTLMADIIAQLPGSQRVLPLNVVMSLFGVPVILWIILRQRQLRQSFAA